MQADTEARDRAAHLAHLQAELQEKIDCMDRKSAALASSEAAAQDSCAEAARRTAQRTVL